VSVDIIIKPSFDRYFPALVKKKINCTSLHCKVRLSKSKKNRRAEALVLPPERTFVANVFDLLIQYVQKVWKHPNENVTRNF
jgi:hypothetical protein